MQKRKLGKSGLDVSVLGMGCMNLSFGTGPAKDKAEGVKVIHAGYEQGITFFDTAEAYGPYKNEALVGEGVAPFRKEVIVATKFGFNLETGTITGADSRPETIRKAHAVLPVAAVQNQYSIWAREPEQSVLPLCEERGIGFVPWAPLGTGFLTGKITADTKFDSGTDLRAAFPRFTREAIKANMPVVELLVRIATRKNATPVQIALAWLLAQKPFIVPIPGMDKVEYIDDNLKSLNIELTVQDFQEVKVELSKIKIHGARLDEGLLSMSES